MNSIPRAAQLKVWLDTGTGTKNNWCHICGAITAPLIDFIIPNNEDLSSARSGGGPRKL
jgi:hypothetical protein